MAPKLQSKGQEIIKNFYWLHRKVLLFIQWEIGLVCTRMLALARLHKFHINQMLKCQLQSL